MSEGFFLAPSPAHSAVPFPLQANLSEQQVSSNTFIRALMTSVCHLAIVCEYQGEVGVVEVPLPELPLSHPVLSS